MNRKGNHQIADIEPHYAGFGMYQACEYNGDVLNDMYDWQDVLNDAGEEFYTADDPDIPPDALDALNRIDGNCYDQPDILVAVRVDSGWHIKGVQYFVD